jgi:hypothetical protein
MERRQQILALAAAIQATFSSSEWTEIGYLTSTDEYINRHPRLLRSLTFGDNDYKGHVIDAVAHMIESDETNLKRLVEYEPITSWLKVHDAGAFQSLQAEVYGTIVPGGPADRFAGSCICPSRRADPL